LLALRATRICRDYKNFTFCPKTRIDPVFNAYADRDVMVI